ncbi:hypothetical protein BV133_1123 [Blastochloris viridis]|uniref:Uncharacterized protein n=1 Tax=Blastochloris viridis TaxID=1079 RepID=A0A182CZQ1_BLAVI|nr:hypothetical protein BV133_1123 [Blastochloris viridis]
MAFQPNGTHYCHDLSVVGRRLGPGKTILARRPVRTRPRSTAAIVADAEHWGTSS